MTEPPSLEDICQKVSNNKFELSKHALDRSILRKIFLSEIQECFLQAEIIEDYPDDHYGPSCLVLGFTATRRPLHIQCSYPTRPILKIITLYEPDESQWFEFKIRKQ